MEYITSINFSITSENGKLTEVELRYLLTEKVKTLARQLEQDKDTEFNWEIADYVEDDNPWST